jgi:hypothetical protein
MFANDKKVVEPVTVEALAGAIMGWNDSRHRPALVITAPRRVSWLRARAGPASVGCRFTAGVGGHDRDDLCNGGMGSASGFDGFADQWSASPGMTTMVIFNMGVSPMAISLMAYDL